MQASRGALEKRAFYQESRAPHVRAVIVNYGSAELTLRCLQSLRGQDYAPLELVVVDNHSPEADWSTLRGGAGSSVVLYRTPRNLGYAGGINAGARLDTGQAADYILALNSDVSLDDPKSVLLLVTALQQDPRRVACSPLIRDQRRNALPEECVQVRRMPDYWTLLVAHSCWLRRTRPGHRMQDLHRYIDRIPFPLSTTMDCDTVNGACFMVSQEFLSEVGFMDERTFLYMEEFTLGEKIRGRHSTACLCTSVVADHIQGASTGMRANHRPLRRELQQIQSEAFYLRQYTGAGLLKMGLFGVVRTTDLLLKAIRAPFGSGA